MVFDMSDSIHHRPTFPRLILGWAGAIAIAALPAGCAVGPDFVPPKAPDAARYTEGPMPAHTAASPSAEGQSLVAGKDIPAQWWRLFHSQALNALIKRAIQHSPDLRAAQAALAEARENVSAQQGSLFPALDASFSARRQKTAGALFGNPGGGGSLFTLYNASVSVSYTLDIFGGVRRQIEALAAQADFQRYQLEAAYLALTANIATAAIQEASLREQIGATESMVDARSRQLEVVTRQFELGGASQLDVLAQTTDLEQIKTTLPPLQLQLAQTRHHLTVLAGELPGSGLASAFNLADLHLPLALPLSLPSKLVEQRPDIRAQEAQLHAASAQIGVATANMLPNLTLSAGMGSIATQLGNLFMPGSSIWNAGLNLLQPVFHGGELLHKRRAALATFEQAAAQYRSTVLAAFQNVADVLRALEYDAETLKTQDAAERAAADSLDVTRRQYQSGSVSYLALLDAERSYQQSRIGQIKAQAARYADTAALFQALGGGWWNRAGDEAAAGGAEAGRPAGAFH